MNLGPPRAGTRLGPCLAAMLIAAAPAAPAVAQIEDVSGRLVVELNAAHSTEGGCTFSFLLVNGLAAPIDALIVEAVLFDTGGGVERLTLFDFGRLPAGRPRVRQFAVPGPACDGFGAILINGAETCDMGADMGPDPGATTICEDGLDPRSRVAIELLG